MAGTTPADVFMWFPDSPVGIQGETIDSYFQTKKAFEVLSLDFSMTMGEAEDSDDDNDGGDASIESETVKKPKRAKRASGLIAPVKFNALTITKTMDFASPYLYQAMCKHWNKQEDRKMRIPTAHIAMRKSGGPQMLYIQFILRDVVISEIKWNLSGAEGPPTETITFAFNAMGLQYVKQASLGTPGGAVDNQRYRMQWGWDTALNQSASLGGYLPERL